MLITPVQRLPRYELLSKELIKVAEKDGLEHSKVISQLKNMSELAANQQNNNMINRDLRKDREKIDHLWSDSKQFARNKFLPVNKLGLKSALKPFANLLEPEASREAFCKKIASGDRQSFEKAMEIVSAYKKNFASFETVPLDIRTAIEGYRIHIQSIVEVNEQSSVSLSKNPKLK